MACVAPQHAGCTGKWSGFLILRFSIHVGADGAFRPWSGAEAGAWY
jgi:hypothetical protein